MKKISFRNEKEKYANTKSTKYKTANKQENVGRTLPICVYYLSLIMVSTLRVAS